MTSSDLFVTAIEDARAGTPPQFPHGGVDAFLKCAPEWPPVRLAQEAVTLSAEIVDATQTALYSFDGATYHCVALCPPQLDSPLTVPQGTSRFPWGIGTVMASRFILIEDAAGLSASISSAGDVTLGALGLRSAVHLPLWAGNRSVGAVHLYWESPVAQWDDRPGALLRALGVYALECIRRVAERDLRSAVEPSV